MESKRIEFFNKLSFITLLSTLFLSLFFFIPYVPVTLEASKGFLLSIGTTLAVFFWLIARLGEGKFTVPKDRLILSAAIIPVVFLIASLFSSSLYISLFGNGFEMGTFGSMLILFVIFFLSSMYFQTEKRLWYFFKALFLGALILSVFELLNMFVGFGRFLPGLLQGVSSGNLVGSWNNFAVLFGLIVLLSVFTIEFLKTKGFNLFVQYFLLVSGLFFLVVINMPLVWLLVGLFSTIIFVYSVSIQHAGVKIIYGAEKKRFPFVSLIIMFFCLSFLIGSNSLGGLVSKYINLSNPEVRPSIVTTSQIAWKAIKHNPAFGTGPNTFVIDWALWQPKEIASTVFWNSDFNNGFSSLFTYLVTTGILGLLAWIAFFVIFIIRGIQSIRIALKDPLSNYFIMTTFMVSLYSWITFIVYTPNILILMLAFTSSGILIGILVYKKVVPVKTLSFLNDPRNSFFAILALMVLMVITLSVSYLYVEKFTSVIYFSKGLSSNENTMESLIRSEKMLTNAISLDKSDIYYRTLSQVYIAEIGSLINQEGISKDILKSQLQQLINFSQNSASLAVNQNPKQYLNYFNLGNVYAALVPLSVDGSYESAIASYSKAETLAPNNPSIVLAKAQLEFSKKNNDEARKYIQQALGLKLNYTDALFLLAQIETNEGNASGAINQVERAAQLSPNDATIFFRLGLLRYNGSQYANAIGAFEQAVMLDNSYLNARYFLGLSYQKAGRNADALTQFNILSKVLPNNQDIKKAIDSLSVVSSSDITPTIPTSLDTKAATKTKTTAQSLQKQ